MNTPNDITAELTSGSLDPACCAVAPVTFDVDDELTAWWEIQAETAARAGACEPRHRCPPDMSPCPECEERNAQEDFIEYGSA